MEPISLIIAALCAGALAATKETAGTAVKDAYQGLKTLIKKKLEGDALGQAMVDAKPEEIKQAEGLLKDKISKAGIDKDDAIVKSAQELLIQLNPEQTAAGESYQLNVQGNFTGVGRDVNTGGGQATLDFSSKN